MGIGNVFLVGLGGGDGGVFVKNGVMMMASGGW